MSGDREDLVTAADAESVGAFLPGAVLMMLHADRDRVLARVFALDDDDRARWRALLEVHGLWPPCDLGRTGWRHAEVLVDVVEGSS